VHFLGTCEKRTAQQKRLPKNNTFRPQRVSPAVNVYHLVAAAFGIDSRAEWSASKAMLADMPSRLEQPHKHHANFLKMGFKERMAVFPTAEEWADPIIFCILNCVVSLRYG